jgi:membrane protease YdiL (CAAX protease family)
MNVPRPLVDAFRGDQLRPTLILATAPVLMVTWRYYGSPEFYRESLTQYVPSSGDPATAAALYSFVCCFVLLGVVPALMVKLVFSQRLSDYGVQLGQRASTLRWVLIGAPVFVLLGYLSANDPAVAAEYPINSNAGISPPAFALHACAYALFYMGWEFYFRGFLQFGLRDSLGAVNALWVQVLASVLLHIGKPDAEIFGAILGGILWGLVAYQTRSLLAGLSQHFLLGISLDWFLCYG